MCVVCASVCVSVPFTYPVMSLQVDTTVPYDARYALRVCQEEKVDRACVHVYSVMGLLEEAVQLALTVSSRSVCMLV